MNKDEKNKLVENLPKNWVSILQKKTGFSETYVRKVIKGNLNKESIEREALLLAIEYKKEKQALEDLKKEAL